MNDSLKLRNNIKDISEFFVKKQKYIFLLLLIMVSLLLRFNIGSYAYCKDEADMLSFVKNGTNTFSKEFIFNTKRPPFQYQLAQVMQLGGVDLDNEFIMRIPFVLASLLSIIFLFLYLNRLTNNPFASFIGSMVFAVNGLTVALGKIVQYQSFVMLFSAITLYLFHIYSTKRDLKTLLLGVASF
jgi:4-amino-4-deoxy-L-arabinose transferase-like glycosyltransferase